MTEHSEEIEYHVFEHYSKWELAREIEQAARHGFKLQGGVAIAVRQSGDLTYSQAMVRNRPGPKSLSR